MTNIHPFGKPDEVKKADDGRDTPQQKKFEATTGKDSDGATGDVNNKKVETSRKNAPKESDAKQQAWDAAERVAIGKYGGFSGVSKERKKEMIQEILDQQGEAVEQTKKWEGTA